MSLVEELSERQIACLVGLVEDRLVALSRELGEDAPDFHELQSCHDALLAQAGAMRRQATLAGLIPSPRPQRARLHTIQGGKV